MLKITNDSLTRPGTRWFI